MTLDAQIAEHRNLYRDEIRGRTTQRQVPAETEAIPVDEGMVEVTDSGELGGMSFTPEFMRRLGPGEGFGARFPWAHSWSWLRRACRHDHPGHVERSSFGGALCWQLVSSVVVGGSSPQEVAWRIGLPVADVERHLRRAFAWIIEDMDRKQRIRNARDPRPSEEPTPTRIGLLQCDAATRAVQNFELEERIWNSQREIQRTYGLELPPWEVEWQRRQEALYDHQQQCDRCRRAA